MEQRSVAMHFFLSKELFFLAAALLQVTLNVVQWFIDKKKCNGQIAGVHVEYPWSIKATTCSLHMFNFDGSRYPKTYEPSQLVMI